MRKALCECNYGGYWWAHTNNVDINHFELFEGWIADVVKDWLFSPQGTALATGSTFTPVAAALGRPENHIYNIHVGSEIYNIGLH